MNHSNIIKYFKWFNEDGKVYFVKEYVDNGSLKNLKEAYRSINKPIEENTLWNIFMQCMAGLDYLHSNNIVHKNLKSNNILMNENKVIKIDDIQFDPGPKDKSDDIREMGEIFSELIPIEFQNQYPQEMIGIVNAMKNNFKNINSTQLLNKIMEQYIKSVAKVSSINAIFRCMSALQPFSYAMYQKQNSFSENNTPVAYYYMQCLNTYFNQNGNPKDIIIYYNNFRNLLYKNSQMNNDVEIRPRQVLEFLLERLNRETDTNLRGVSFSTQIMIFEKDKETSLKKFSDYFKNNFNSIISNNFVGYIKTVRICNACGERNYSFNIHPFIEFDMDMSQVGDNKYPLNLLENWFRAQNNQKKVLSVEHKIVCQSNKCRNKVTEHREFKQFYYLPQCFIISLNRGKNYTNTYQPQIPLILDLKNKIEIKDSPSQFNLVGMVKRFVDDKQEEHFVAIYIDIQQNIWRVSDRDNVQVINDPFLHNQGLIITLFYSAINNMFGQ